MPFGMRNFPATFQHLINRIISQIDGCEGYIDDVIIFYNDTWEEHQEILRKFFKRLSEAKLTINLVKSDFSFQVFYYKYFPLQPPLNKNLHADFGHSYRGNQGLRRSPSAVVLLQLCEHRIGVNLHYEGRRSARNGTEYTSFENRHVRDCLSLLARKIISSFPVTAFLNEIIYVLQPTL
ncbi:Hypothetical predicted protein, partial [Paramuricea clavata]